MAARLGSRLPTNGPGLVSDRRPQGGTWFMVYLSEFAGTAKSTSMRFEVEDIEVAVKELRDRGIVFEEYDLGSTV